MDRGNNIDLESLKEILNKIFSSEVVMLLVFVIVIWLFDMMDWFILYTTGFHYLPEAILLYILFRNLTELRQITKTEFNRTWLIIFVPFISLVAFMLSDTIYVFLIFGFSSIRVRLALFTLFGVTMLIGSVVGIRSNKKIKRYSND